MSILQFLSQRSVQNAEFVANKLEEQKIDVNVIKCMYTDDAFLCSILPQYGDRLALINFAKQTNVSKRKSALFDKLMSKVKKNNDDICESFIDSPNQSFVPKKNHQTIHTSLPNRFVEIGWLNFEFSNYKQVRTRNGGGTRKVHVNKNCVKSDLIDLAIQLFFPNGTSSNFGPIEQFKTDLFDFQRNVLPGDLSVAELYLKTGLNSLRFYLATDLKDRISNDSKSNSKIFSSPEKTVTNYVVASSTKSLFDVSPSNSPTSLWLSNNDNFENIFDGYNNLDESLKNEERITDVYVEQQIHNNLIDHNYYTVPEPLEEKTKLILHRGRIFNELIEAFKLIKMYPQFQFELILPNGSVENAIDVGGVFKDVLAEFWSSFYEMATTGCNWKIPIIRHDFQDEQWQAIGKIIFIGWRDIQYLPLSLALPFMEYVICGTVVNNQDLVDGFLNTLPFKSKDILQNALKDFKQIDEDELLDILQEFDCRLVVNEKNIKDVVSEIAHKEIIQRPKYIIDIWSEELRNKVIPIISKISLQEMYINKVPTSTNLLKNLQCPDKDESEIKRKVFGFLKKFIREADQMLCTKFLRFVTGSDIITDCININFTSAKDNYSRSPVAHTCTNTLDLPMSYDRFIDLRSEINSILASNVWVMDIA